jgi:hypothetical protein
MQKYRTFSTLNMTVASENLIVEKYEPFRWQCDFLAADTVRCHNVAISQETLSAATACRYTVCKLSVVKTV